VFGAWVLQLGPLLFVLTTVCCFLLSSGIAAYGVGRGALKPLFDAASVSELAVGPHALTTMLNGVAVAFVGAVGALFAGVAIAAGPRAGVLSEGVAALLGAAFLLGPALFAVQLGRRSLQAGAAAFARRRDEEAAGSPAPRDVGPINVEE
jgi:hypothetical protein